MLKLMLALVLIAPVPAGLSAAADTTAPPGGPSKMIVRSRTKTSRDPPFTPRRIAVDVACVTEDGSPVSGAEVTLYEQGWGLEYRQTAIKVSNTRGLCRFEGVALPDPDVAFLTMGITVWLCNVSAQAAGRASVMGGVLSGNVIGSTATVALVMHPAQRLTGRVTTFPKGEPLSGASVYLSVMYNQKSTGLRCTRTDKDGRYQLTDLDPWSAPNDGIVRPSGKKGRMTAGRQLPVWVYHPDYGATYARCRAVPGTTDVQIDRAGTLVGRVVDATTGQLAAGVSMWAVSVPKAGNRLAYGTNWSVTDQNGKYRMPVPAGNVYRVQINKEGFYETAPRPLSKVVVANAATAIPDISISKVGSIRGRLVEAASGQPLSFPSKPRISISLGGPISVDIGNHPWLVEVNADGTFVRRAVPSGRSYSLSVKSSDPAVKDNSDFGELTIGAGETVAVDLPVEPLNRQ